MFSRSLIFATGLLLLLHGAALADVPARVEYARDVLPILSDGCYHCHGPDEKARKLELRLDTKEGTYRTRKGVTVVVPGKPEQSELVRRITSKDPDEVMPPPDSNRHITPQQIETLKRWVEQGAPWGVHWAFVAPKRGGIPKTKLQGWARNPIDSFVLAHLEEEKLAPAPEADRATLLRRITFDLTGLPPTPKEIDEFLVDTSPNAYEKVVDRLLTSPRYGERMASDWLDVARFADTHGYQSDRERPTWPYRDWVIKAFNANLPWDQFTTWQLAGDLLSNATKEQRLATAFNRMHMQNEEGGVIEEEFRVAYVVDRVTTMGTAFMGLTFECSRCHDHKYDPITQKDFYSLFAFFQNIDESGQTSYFTDATPVPTLLLSTGEQDAKLAELRAKIEAKQKELVEAREKVREGFSKWDGALPQRLPGLVASFSFDAIKDGKIANSIDPSKPGNAVEGPQIISDHGTLAKLDGENGFTFPGIGHFSRADAFSLAIWLQPAELAPRQVVLHHSKAPVDAGSRGYELLLENGHVAFGLHHMWPGNSLKVATNSAIEVNDRTHVLVTYDGSSRAEGVRIYVNGERVKANIVRDGLWKDITYGGAEPDLAIGYRFRDNGFKGGMVDDFQVYNRALTPVEAARVAGVDAPRADRDALFDYYVANVDPTTTKLQSELHALRKQQADTINPIPESMAMKEMDPPKPAYILKRGAYDARGEEVHADTPHSMPPFPSDQPRNRLGFARWLLAPDHPLTARVTVNRFWQQMFGRGIVETSDNFGSQGAQPTHQELLDYLARSFVDDMQWDVKQLLKTIAMSATYRQSSHASLELLQRDPANHLLARGPARRLTAEMLRDQALSLSGLLVEKLGGPSVRPYQPDGLWDVAMGHPNYNQGHGADLYRRSLYTFWKRTVPPPAMVAFDAADRSYCTARRQSTSTPLQALALLNDPQTVESARFIAQRMLKEGGTTPDQRIKWAFRLVTGREPLSKEVEVLTQLWSEQHELFNKDAQATTKLLGVGESKSDSSIDARDVAAGTVFAIALLNHDAAVMRR